jgi:hypothetical protein
MEDPVCLYDLQQPGNPDLGHSYERAAIEMALRRVRRYPKTGIGLIRPSLQPNRTLKSSITMWKQLQAAQVHVARQVAAAVARTQTEAAKARAAAAATAADFRDRNRKHSAVPRYSSHGGSLLLHSTFFSCGCLMLSQDRQKCQRSG